MAVPIGFSSLSQALYLIVGQILALFTNKKKVVFPRAKKPRTFGRQFVEAAAGGRDRRAVAKIT